MLKQEAIKPESLNLLAVKHYLKILQHQKHPTRFIVGKLLCYSKLSSLFIIRQSRFRLRFYPTNLSFTLWLNPTSREEARSLFCAYPQPGDYVVDVGGNVGDVSLCFTTKVGQQGHVLTIEPHPRTFHYLLGNFKLNCVTNASAVNCALGQEPGMVGILDDKRDDMNRVVNDSSAIQVPMKTLDDLVEPGRQIQFLKIDVEGFELAVLRGATSVLSRTDCVCCELGEEHCKRYGYTMADLLSFLVHLNFQLFVQDGPQRISPVQTTFKSQYGEELVALKDVKGFIRRTGWVVSDALLTERAGPLPHQKQ